MLARVSFLFWFFFFLFSCFFFSEKAGYFNPSLSLSLSICISLCQHVPEVISPMNSPMAAPCSKAQHASSPLFLPLGVRYT